MPNLFYLRALGDVDTDNIQACINALHAHPEYVHDPHTMHYVLTEDDHGEKCILPVLDPCAIHLPDDLSPAEQAIADRLTGPERMDKRAYDTLRDCATKWFEARHRVALRDRRAAERRAIVHAEREERARLRESSRSPAQDKVAEALADYTADVADITREYAEAKITADALVAAAKAALQQAKLDAASAKADAYATYTKALRDVEIDYNKRKQDIIKGE